METKRTTKEWLIIMRRELSSYYSSPIAYIVGALFLLFSGFLFFSTFFLAGRANLRYFFQVLPVLFSFFIPAMTMRVFSEEKRSGSMETLVTLPVGTADIVMGKYLSCVVSAVLLLVPTLFYVVTCAVFASAPLDAGPIIGGYIGALLLAAAFCAIGVFFSSVTKNQIVAFFAAFAVCICLTMLSSFAILLPGTLAGVAEALSSSSRFNSISRGIVDSRDVLYFLSLIAAFVALTVKSVSDSKKG